MKYIFNNKYIKDNATAGSWRRGWEYFQQNQVEEITFDGEKVNGKIKGNYKSFYETTTFELLTRFVDWFNIGFDQAFNIYCRKEGVL